MNIDWQAFRDGKIAVLCHSAKECEAFLCEAINQQINVNHSWVENPTSAAANHWLRSNDRSANGRLNIIENRSRVEQSARKITH